MDHELILAQLEEDSMVARAGIEPTANCLEGSFILSLKQRYFGEMF